jgi:hypothetical protein
LLALIKIRSVGRDDSSRYQESAGKRDGGDVSRQAT